MSWGESVEHLARSAEYLTEIAIVRSDTMQMLLMGLPLAETVRTARRLYAAAWRREQDRAPSRYLPTAPATQPARKRPARRAA